jgi:hypothetical protein
VPLPLVLLLLGLCCWNGQPRQTLPPPLLLLLLLQLLLLPPGH